MSASFAQMALSPANVKAVTALASLQSDLSGLRRTAPSDEPGAVATVARQFEGMFVKMMLDAMRATSVGDPLFGGHASLLYRDMLDQQISDKISQGRGIGLADILSRQIQQVAAKNRVKTEGEDPLAADLQSIFSGASRPVRKALPAESPASVPAAPKAPHTPKATVPSPPVRPTETVPVQVPPVTTGPVGGPRQTSVFATPEVFVSSLWPHAVQAGEVLGVSPKILIAQAALETGWGKSVLRHPDGRSSHNLFGIKADARWPGERISATTLEFAGGAMQKRNAVFRSYPDFGQSFYDYVSFVAGEPRYQTATARAQDPAKYIRALQHAGYATDPAYADKVLNVMNRPLVAGLDKGAAL